MLQDNISDSNAKTLSISEVKESIGSPHEMKTQGEQRIVALTEFASFLGSHSVGDGSVWNSNNVEASKTTSIPEGSAVYLANKRIAEQKSRKFTQTSLHKLLGQSLHRDDNEPTGGAICSFPSLDLQSNDSKSLEVDILPGVGVSHKAANSASDESMPPPDPKAVKIPMMAASIFGEENGNNHGGVNNLGQNLSQVPALECSATGTSNAVSNANADAAKLEQAAARNLGAETKWTPSSIFQAPSAMLRSMASSFSSLVDSRVRAWTLLLLRHSLSSGDGESRSRLLGLLATSSRIDLTAIVTTFKVVEFPAKEKNMLEEYKRKEQELMELRQKLSKQYYEADSSKTDDSKDNTSVPSSIKLDDKYDTVLPLLFETTIDVTIEGQKLTVTLRAPGTASAKFFQKSNKMTFVKINVDSNILVSSMVEQARLIVFKAVARATSLPTTASGLRKVVGSRDSVVPTNSKTGVASLSGGFGSALNLQTSQQQSTMMTHKSSSMRIPSMANDSTDNLGLLKKKRSVTWNQPIEDSSNQGVKRHKTCITPSIMRSKKSFGKPDASIFECSRNATFGDFGRVHKSNHIPTYMNGKLQVPQNYNQQASQGFTLSQLNRGPSLGNLMRTRTNADFSSSALNLRKNSSGNTYGLIRNRSGVGNTSGGFSLKRDNGSNGNVSSQRLGRQTFDQLSRNTYSNSSSSASQSNLPRTATALESLLLRASKK